MTWYIGVDPGKHGAAVAISREQIAYQDWSGPGKARDWINYLFDADKIKLAIIEDVNQRRMPDKGRYAAFDLGRYSGYWEMLFICFGIDYQLVAPKIWQAAMIDPVNKFLKNSKHRSLSSARAIDPTVASTLQGSKTTTALTRLSWRLMQVCYAGQAFAMLILPESSKKRPCIILMRHFFIDNTIYRVICD